MGGVVLVGWLVVGGGVFYVFVVNFLLFIVTRPRREEGNVIIRR